MSWKTRAFGRLPNGFKKPFLAGEPRASERTTENLVSWKSGNAAALGRICSSRIRGISNFTQNARHSFRFAVIQAQSREAVANRLQTRSFLGRLECYSVITIYNSTTVRREKESASCLTVVTSRHRVSATFARLRPVSPLTGPFKQADLHGGGSWATKLTPQS